MHGVNAGVDNVLEIVECTFDNCGGYCINVSGQAESMPYLYSNTFTNSYGALSAVNLDEVLFLQNDVQNTEIGVYCSNVASPYLLYNSITSNLNSLPGIFFESCDGLITWNSISGYTNGIYLGNSSPYIGQNEITDNLYHGLSVGSGSYPNVVDQYYLAGYNNFQNNGNTLTGGYYDVDGSEIFISSNANIEMSRGCNSIIDDR